MLLQIEDQVILFINKFIAGTGESQLTPIKTQQIKFTEFDQGVFLCPDVINACRGLYGFYCTENHCYISIIYNNLIQRFKCQLPHQYTSEDQYTPSLDKLNADFHQANPYFLDDVLNHFNLAAQFKDIQKSLTSMINIDEFDQNMMLTFQFLTRKRYGQASSISLVDDVSKIYDYRQFIACFKGIFISTDYFAIRTKIGDKSVVVTIQPILATS